MWRISVIRLTVTEAKFIIKCSLFILLPGVFRLLGLKFNSEQIAEYIFVAPPYCQTACCMPPEQFILMSLVTAFPWARLNYSVLRSCMCSLKMSCFVILWTVSTWSAQSGIYCREWLCVFCRSIAALSLLYENFALSFYEGLLPSVLCHFINRPELKRSIRDILSGVAVRILSHNSSTQFVLWKFWIFILWATRNNVQKQVACNGQGFMQVGN